MRSLWKITVALGLLTNTLASAGCAYKFGLSQRALPGGYTRVAVPVFRNNTPEVGIETFFTNAMVRRFARSQVARVTEKDNAPLVLEGTVRELNVSSGPGVTNRDKQLRELPDNAVLTTEYRLSLQTEIKLRRTSDDKIVWEGTFRNERVYQAPRLAGAVVNSADATYNQSVRTRTISLIADDMMAEAHDRMTENF